MEISYEKALRVIAATVLQGEKITDMAWRAELFTEGYCDEDGNYQPSNDMEIDVLRSVVECAREALGVTLDTALELETPAKGDPEIERLKTVNAEMLSALKQVRQRLLNYGVLLPGAPVIKMLEDAIVKVEDK